MKFFKNTQKMGGGKLIGSLLIGAASAIIPVSMEGASITIDSVAQRWPWNNKVDITYTVSDAQDRAAGVYYGIDFTVTANGRTIPIPGYTIGASAETGTAASRKYTVTWIAPGGIKATDCSITATLYPTNNWASGNDYMIIDLATGKVTYEGLLDSQDTSNKRYNTDEFRTTKMALRKVPKWADKGDLPNAEKLNSMSGYPTGDNVNYYADSSFPNTERTWNTDKDFYVGIFHVTVAQYNSILGGDTTEMKPKTHLTYNQWRDNTLGNLHAPTNHIPINGSGFFARLNAKTRLMSSVSGFDMPTDVMYEIAARAGTITANYWGNENESAYFIESSDTPSVEGTRLPNGWGFYDMIGNCGARVLDTYSRPGTKAPINNMSENIDAFTPYCGKIGCVWRGRQEAKSSRREAGYAVDSRTLYENLGTRVAYIVK